MAMSENTSTWTSDDFALKTVDEYGQTTYEEETYYEKVGQEEEEIVVGSHKEKVGTKKVLVGTHQEKTGTRKVQKKKKASLDGLRIYLILNMTMWMNLKPLKITKMRTFMKL